MEKFIWKKVLLWSLIVSSISIATTILLQTLVIFVNKNKNIVNNENIENDYLKNNILYPFVNGEYSFATPWYYWRCLSK